MRSTATLDLKLRVTRSTAARLRLRFDLRSPHCNSASYIGDPIEERDLFGGLFFCKKFAYMQFLLYFCSAKLAQR